MEIYGNAATCNVERVLWQNIQNSDYYKSLFEEMDAPFLELIDEVYEQVDHCEPWMSGNARGPSTCFCLMYRFMDLKLSENQIKTLLDHPDSTFIRAIGFLYLRYCANPRSLLEWFQPYFKDNEEIAPSGSNGKTITVGVYCRELLLDMSYFETIFPRIPVNVMKDITAVMEQRGLPTKPIGNAGVGGSSRRDDGSGSRRPPSVKAALSVAMGQRAPNRGGGREEGRGKDVEHQRAADKWEKGGGGDRGGGRGGRDDDRGGGRGGDYDRRRDDRDHLDYVRGRGGGGGGRDYDRGTGGGRDYDRDRRGGGGRDDRGGGGRDYGRGGHRDDRGYDRGGRDYDRGRSRGRSRSRSPYRR